MLKIIKRFKWMIIAAAIIIIVFLLIGLVMSYKAISVLIWPISIFGIAALACVIFLKSYSYYTQAEREFTISVSSVFKSPVVPFFSRYVMKYKITVESQNKKIERIVITNNKVIKIDHKNKTLPYQYLEQMLENDIVAVEKMIRDIYPRCKISLPAVLK